MGQCPGDDIQMCFYKRDYGKMSVNMWWCGILQFGATKINCDISINANPELVIYPIMSKSIMGFKKIQVFI